MLFNAYDFLLAFLPVALIGHTALLRYAGNRAARVWLALISLFFYAYWYPPHLGLLIASLAGNYVIGRLVADPTRSARARLNWLRLGVTADLGALAWFKYAGFLESNLGNVFGFHVDLPVWALPIGISFFTFQQIAYIVDSHKTSTYAHDPLDYVLFVTFFPHLIAGPLVHHAEMIPQFQAMRKPDAEDRAVGATMFVLGLAKKVVIADALAPIADLAFAKVGAGVTPTVAGAWVAILAFFFQVYYDFSGYSDMACGLSRMMGLRLPVNFDAPYRSNSMVDFWARWHISLSRFLREYLYIPLGGNRRGTARKHLNMMITMTLGGLWHGASWNFVAWGALNGFYLMVNNTWRDALGGPLTARWFRPIARALTLLAALTGHTFFRAADFDDALRNLGAMFGLRHAGLGFAAVPSSVVLTLLGVFVLNQAAPTSHRWLEAWSPVIKQAQDSLRWPAWATWRPSVRWGVAIGLLFLLCIPLLERASPFIYFQF